MALVVWSFIVKIEYSLSSRWFVFKGISANGINIHNLQCEGYMGWGCNEGSDGILW